MISTIKLTGPNVQSFCNRIKTEGLGSIDRMDSMTICRMLLGISSDRFGDSSVIDITNGILNSCGDQSHELGRILTNRYKLGTVWKFLMFVGEGDDRIQIDLTLSKIPYPENRNAIRIALQYDMVSKELDGTEYNATVFRPLIEYTSDKIVIFKIESKQNFEKDKFNTELLHPVPVAEEVADDSADMESPAEDNNDAEEVAYDEPDEDPADSDEPGDEPEPEESEEGLPGESVDGDSGQDGSPTDIGPGDSESIEPASNTEEVKPMCTDINYDLVLREVDHPVDTSEWIDKFFKPNTSKTFTEILESVRPTLESALAVDSESATRQLLEVFQENQKLSESLRLLRVEIDSMTYNPKEGFVVKLMMNGPEVGANTVWLKVMPEWIDSPLDMTPYIQETKEPEGLYWKVSNVLRDFPGLSTDADERLLYTWKALTALQETTFCTGKLLDREYKIAGVKYVGTENLSCSGYCVEVHILEPERDNARKLEETMNSDKGDEPVQTDFVDITDPEYRNGTLMAMFGTTAPSANHVHTYLNDYHNANKTKSFLETKIDGQGTYPTESDVFYDNVVWAFVKMKDGKFWRIAIAHRDFSLADESWIASHHIPGRWVTIAEVQDGPSHYGYRRRSNW